MTRKIAILGWGSLLWHPQAAFESRHGEWRFDGPWLPLEFSRVSPASKGGLTLVIDPVHGHPTQTAYTISTRDTADEARRDLQEREWAKTVDLIGCFDRGAGAVASRGDCVGTAIADWAAAKTLDAVV
jgi:cation transport regulator ChaC